MITIVTPRLRGRRLEPVEWRVRDALSPFWSGWSQRFYSLLVCDEGIAAFQWPSRKYWPVALMVGFRAGVAHLPSSIIGDSWPLSAHMHVVDAPSALLFPRADLRIVEIRRRRWLTNEVRLIDTQQVMRRFTAADPRKVGEYAMRLSEFYTVVKTGYWPQIG